MAKKNKKPRPKKIRHPKYREHNISTLDQHRRQGNDLTPPLAALPSLFLSSWYKEALPDFLWAAILAAHLDRDDYLSLFREIIGAGQGLSNYKNPYSFAAHSSLSLLSDDGFDSVMAPLLNRQDAKDLLSALLLFEGLPDRRHWERQYLSALDPQKHGTIVGQAVIDHFDHQSEKATDCKWLKVSCLLAAGGVTGPDGFDERIRNYPSSEAGSSIRAFEMSLRDPNFVPDAAKEWCATFWNESWEKTECILTEMTKPDVSTRQFSVSAFWGIYQAVSEHAEASIKDPDVNPRFDAAFGLVLYGVYLAMKMSHNAAAFSAEARIMLRTIVESFITLKYLSVKDDSAVWMQYRNYGTGQSKLAFLKLLEMDSVPDYVHAEDLEMHANADMWMEFQDIKLGAWDNKNLRKMAEEAGVKDIYDKYYDWPSSFVHANWGAVRDTVFQVCFNPLHRLHRVPFIPRVNMGDTTMDAAKLVNLMLEELNKLYPTFKPRIKTG